MQIELSGIPKIAENRRYWFIRTYSGVAFPSYYADNYVGLGVNNVPVNLMKDVHVSIKSKDFVDDDMYEVMRDLGDEIDVMDNRSAFMRLADYIDLNTEYHRGQATRVATQLAHFENSIKIGDTIVIPSKHSNQFAIGTVESEPYSRRGVGTFKFKNQIHTYPTRRRDIKWERLLNKEDLQGDFRSITTSTFFGIANVDNYKDVIDGTIQSLYIRDSHAYLTLKVNQDEDINAFVLSRFLNGLTYFYEEFCVEQGYPKNEDLTIKIKLQSQGKVLFKALGIGAVVGIAAMVAASDNNEVKLELGKSKIEGKSTGFIKSISNFLDAKEERRERFVEFQDSMQQLKAMRYDDSLRRAEEFKKSKEKASDDSK